LHIFTLAELDSTYTNIAVVKLLCSLQTDIKLKKFKLLSVQQLNINCRSPSIWHSVALLDYSFCFSTSVWICLCFSTRVHHLWRYIHCCMVLKRVNHLNYKSLFWLSQMCHFNIAVAIATCMESNRDLYWSDCLIWLLFDFSIMECMWLPTPSIPWISTC